MGCDGLDSADAGYVDPVLSDFCIINFYDDDGNRLSMTNDVNCDGISEFDVCSTYTFDKSGNELTKTEDDGCDDEDDDCFVYTYDAEKNMKTIAIDGDCDGSYNSCEIDVTGVGIIYDDDCNGPTPDDYCWSGEYSGDDKDEVPCSSKDFESLY